MLLGIEFKRAKTEGRTWYMVSPVVDGTPRQRNATKALIFLTIFTIVTFALAGTISPDPIIKPDTTAVIWGGR